MDLIKPQVNDRVELERDTTYALTFNITKNGISFVPTTGKLIFVLKRFSEEKFRTEDTNLYSTSDKQLMLTGLNFSTLEKGDYNYYLIYEDNEQERALLSTGTFGLN